MSKWRLQLPARVSHKGQNGRVLIVGGSKLFHAASLWSAQMAAHLVDMVFYASTSENNELVRLAKSNFSDGIVIEREQIMDYAREAEVILVGPGMTRDTKRPAELAKILAKNATLTGKQWQDDTYLITNGLLHSLAGKKFVLDAGALQLLEIKYLTNQCILTPHQGELALLQEQARSEIEKDKLAQATILSKNITDEVWHDGQCVAQITGGNQGLTKGGSGDVLAGLVAGLACYNESAVACYWASRTLKKAAETLYQDYGPFFTTTQLGQQVPRTLWQLINKDA